MQVEIEIPGIKPLLLNDATKITTRGKYPSKYKTDEAKFFEVYVKQYLQSKVGLFKDLVEHYDISKHYVVVDFKFYLPLFTKKGLISKRSGDWDGLIKYTQDVIFDFIEIDDSQIISGCSTKIHSEDFNIIANISIKDLNSIK